MDFTIQVGASALFTRNVIQWMKDRGWLNNGFTITVVNFLVNIVIVFVLQVLTALNEGTTFSGTLLKSTAATILAAIYHDIVSPTVTPTIQVVDSSQAQG